MPKSKTRTAEILHYYFFSSLYTPLLMIFLQMSTIDKPRQLTIFGDLPKEIRDIIWDMAIQSERAEQSVHILSLASRDMEPREVKLGRKATLRIEPWVNWTSWLGPSSLSERYGQSSSCAANDNPSAHLLDTGLWNGCLESREAMLR